MSSNGFWAVVWVLMVVNLAAASLNPEGYARGILIGSLLGVVLGAVGVAAHELFVSDSLLRTWLRRRLKG